MAARSALAKELHVIADAWGYDPMRPAQMKTFLNSLADHPKLTPSAVAATRALYDNQFAKKVGLLIPRSRVVL
jgi:hypothetical protein